MWIINRHGFQSIVRDPNNDTRFIVRARMLSDLDDLRRYAGEADGRSDPIPVQVTGHTDYRYRVSVNDSVLGAWLIGVLADIGYTTGVKDHCDKGEQDRRDAYYDVWLALSDLQPYPPYRGPEAIVSQDGTVVL